MLQRSFEEKKSSGNQRYEQETREDDVKRREVVFLDVGQRNCDRTDESGSLSGFIREGSAKSNGKDSTPSQTPFRG